MSEKLTVAELLARAQQEGTTRSDRPRRRRRSLDEGGISVGELTGSIPVVKDRTSADHAGTSEQALADDTAAAEPKDAEQPQNPEKRKPIEEPKDAEPKKAESKKAEPQTSAESGQRRKDAFPRTDSIPFVVPAAPRPVSVDDATGDITYSFGEVAAADPEAPPFEAPGSPAVGTLESGETEVFPTVPAVADETDEEVDLGAARVAGSPEAEAADVEQAHYDEHGSYSDEYHEEEYEDEYHEVEDDHDEYYQVDDQNHEDEHLDEVEGAHEHDDDEEVEDDAISWPVLILEVIVGLAVGAGIFLGFEKLWGSAPAWLAIALAVAVIILLIAIVRVLRRERDTLTMVMAAAAGAAITFGPALLSN